MDADSDVLSRDAYIGYGAGVAGQVTIADEGSSWTISRELYVAKWGNGLLNILQGGTVAVNWWTWVGPEEGSVGRIHFDNGTLTTRSLIASPDQLTGTGQIITRGLVSDIDLTFDASHGSNQTFTLTSLPGQNITLVLNRSNSGDLGVGYKGQATLRVKDGQIIYSLRGYLGYHAGSHGQAIVEGWASEWNSVWYLYLGKAGTGTLQVSKQGRLFSGTAYVGDAPGSYGEITIDGVWTVWANADQCFIGHYGTGIVNVLNGADFFPTASPYSTSAVYIGVAVGSVGRVNVENSNFRFSLGGDLYIGYSGFGTLSLTNGSSALTGNVYLGYSSSGEGHAVLSGPGSTWGSASSFISFYIGYAGLGTLSITDGGSLRTTGSSYIARNAGSRGQVLVDGPASTWIIGYDLYVGDSGSGVLTITNGGLVVVRGTLWIDRDLSGDSFINMASGGMLALYGKADESLEAFLNLVRGTDAIRYWDGANWVPLVNGILGVDYTLTYIQDGSLQGYTLLAVPEPAGLAVLVLAGLSQLRRRGVA